MSRHHRPVKLSFAVALTSGHLDEHLDRTMQPKPSSAFKERSDLANARASVDAFSCTEVAAICVTGFATVLSSEDPLHTTLRRGYECQWGLYEALGLDSSIIGVAWRGGVGLHLLVCLQLVWGNGAFRRLGLWSVE